MDEADAAAVDEELSAAKSRLGQTLGGKWRLDSLLGVGGMAAVYSATHKNNLKNVAVKVLHAELQRHETVRTRFLREGYVANKVGHSGAVSVIDDGIDDDGSVFLVMELLNGKSLAQRLDEAGGKLAPREMLTIADGLLDVLSAAHLQNVVHRDLKPDNVFITEDGGVKVLDFGVARVLDARGEAKTRTGIVMGTPEYMPQEQARGRSELIDGRTDLWAVGAIMWRLLAGRYVHMADTQNEVLLLAMTEPPKPVAEVLPGVSPKIGAIIDRALAYEPKDRFADAETMRAAVQDALADLEAQDAKSTLMGNATAEQIALASSPSSLSSSSVISSPSSPRVTSTPGTPGATGTPGADDEDVDDAAKTIPVSDFARQKTTPATGEVRSGDILARAAATSEPGSDSSPRAPMTSKPNLWVHTKATPREPPREPKKKRRILPIALGVVVVAGLGVGAAYAWPRWHGAASGTGGGDTASATAPSGSGEGTTLAVDDPDADVDGGDDDYEVEEDDASPPGPTTATPPATHAVRPVSPNPHPTQRPHHIKKKKHR